MRPGGETVANTMKSLFGAGAAKQRAPKPSLTKLPAAGFPAKPMDAFAKASRASLTSVPTTRPIAKPPAIPSGPDGIVIGGTVMEQTKGLMKRIETLAPRGYRYFPKMGRMAAHWIDPGHLPISEAQVQRVMRRALAKPAAAPSRNATLGGDKVALPGQGGGGTGKKSAAGSEAAVRGGLSTGESKTDPSTFDPTFAQIGPGIAPGPVTVGAIERDILRKFHKRSRYRLRTAKGDRITFVAPNGTEIFTIPRAFAIQFAKASGKGAEGRLRLIADIVSGRLSEKETEARARALFVRKDPGPDANLIPALGGDIDKEKMTGVREALAAIRAGRSKAMVGKVLAYSLLPEGISNEREVRALLLDFLPVVGEIRSGREAVKNYANMIRAVRQEDWKAAASLGLFGALNTVGAVPGIGRLFKPVARSVVRVLRSTPGLKAAHATFMLRRFFKQGEKKLPSISPVDVVGRQWKFLSHDQQKLWRALFSTIKGHAGEKEADKLFKASWWHVADIKRFPGEGVGKTRIYDAVVAKGLPELFEKIFGKNKVLKWSGIEVKVDRSTRKALQRRADRVANERGLTSLRPDPIHGTIRISEASLLSLSLHQIPEKTLLETARGQLARHIVSGRLSKEQVDLMLKQLSKWHRQGPAGGMTLGKAMILLGAASSSRQASNIGSKRTR